MFSVYWMCLKYLEFEKTAHLPFPSTRTIFAPSKAWNGAVFEYSKSWNGARMDYNMTE